MCSSWWWRYSLHVKFCPCPEKHVKYKSLACHGILACITSSSSEKNNLVFINHCDCVSKSGLWNIFCNIQSFVSLIWILNLRCFTSFSFFSRSFFVISWLWLHKCIFVSTFLTHRHSHIFVLRLSCSHWLVSCERTQLIYRRSTWSTWSFSLFWHLLCS